MVMISLHSLQKIFTQSIQIKSKGLFQKLLQSLKILIVIFQKRIELDSKNLISYDHFIDGKNWDHPT